jgi:hypothetical protein
MEFTIKSRQPVYPLGYVDGFGLYNGYFAEGFMMDPSGNVAENPLTGYDTSDWGGSNDSKQCCPEAKNMSDADCCRKAYRSGSDHGSAGGVVCCHGRKVSCVWKKGGITNPRRLSAVKIIKECIKQHEDVHHDDVQCPDTCGISRGGTNNVQTRNQSECSAYTTQLTCMYRGIRKCKDDICRKAVKAEIEEIKLYKDDFCGLAGW